jgi:hypothetical protein
MRHSRKVIGALLCFLSQLSTLSASELPADFDFYFEDFKTHQLNVKDPLTQLIHRGLAESLFNAKNEVEFLRLSHLLRSELEKNPHRSEHFYSLEQALQWEFEVRLAKAKERKIIYSASGAVVGVLVGIPAGYFLSKHFGQRLFWLLVPVTALAGAGAGFFFADIRHGLPEEFGSNIFNEDLKQIQEELAKELP